MDFKYSYIFIVKATSSDHDEICKITENVTDGMLEHAEKCLLAIRALDLDTMWADDDDDAFEMYRRFLTYEEVEAFSEYLPNDSGYVVDTIDSFEIIDVAKRVSVIGDSVDANSAMAFIAELLSTHPVRAPFEKRWMRHCEEFCHNDKDCRHKQIHEMGEDCSCMPCHACESFDK